MGRVGEVSQMAENNRQQRVFDATPAGQRADLLESILDDSSQMVQLSTLDDMRMAYANGTARNYTGRASEDYHGRHCYEYMMGRSEQCPFCPLRAMGDASSAETEVDNGQQVYKVKTRLTNYHGQRAFVEYAMDITQIRRAEQTFERQMQTLLNSIPEAQGIMQFDLTADECLSVNGAATNNLKTVHAAVPVDKTMAEVFAYVPDKELRTKYLGIYNREALLAAYEAGSVEIAHEMPSYFDDGSIRTARVTVRMMPNPTTGHIECVLFGLDITEEAEERDKLVRELDESASIFEALSRDYLNVFLVDTVANKVRILKLDGYVTPGMDQADGAVMDYDKTVTNYIESRVWPEDKPMMYALMSRDAIRDALRESDEYVKTYRAQVDGEPHYYQFKYVATDDRQNAIAGFQNVDALIAEERKQRDALTAALHAAKQSSLAKSTFLSSMSHDIRTPLNAIVGFSNLAREHATESETVLRYLDKVDTASANLLSLINDVLDMSSIESGKAYVDEKPVSLVRMASELETIARESAREKGVGLEVSLAGVEHVDVLADETKVKKVLLNILSNAVKFTPAGGTVTFTVEERDDLAVGKPRYVFTVRDTGCGMDEEFQAHVFETFAREEGTGTQGTGLGMSIAKSLVDIMGGSITVASEKGKGTEFVVTLRLEPTNGVAEEEDAPAETYSLEDKRVLLVEDNDFNREIATEILRAAGAEVETAEDGSQAVDAVVDAPAGHFDVVLMDIQMPHMNGYEATRHIRSLADRAKAHVPILAVTANAFDSDRDAALAAGMNGHISKPIDVEALLSMMSEILR